MKRHEVIGLLRQKHNKSLSDIGQDHGVTRSTVGLALDGKLNTNVALSIISDIEDKIGFTIDIPCVD